MGFRFVYRPPSFRAWFQKIRRGRGIVGAPPSPVVPPIDLVGKGTTIRNLVGGQTTTIRELVGSASTSLRLEQSNV